MRIKTGMYLQPPSLLSACSAQPSLPWPCQATMHAEDSIYIPQAGMLFGCGCASSGVFNSSYFLVISLLISSCFCRRGPTSRNQTEQVLQDQLCALGIFHVAMPKGHRCKASEQGKCLGWWQFSGCNMLPPNVCLCTWYMLEGWMWASLSNGWAAVLPKSP